MAAKPSAKINVQNPDGFHDMLARMGEAVTESTIRQAGAAAASVVLREAKRRVPVSWYERHQGKDKFPPGFGRDSLLVSFIPEKSVEGRLATYRVTWSKDAYYLRFVEYGTSKMAAQPFFIPSIVSTKNAQLYAIEEHFHNAMEKAANG
jgi:HK97 gp10 family phage protein